MNEDNNRITKIEDNGANAKGKATKTKPETSISDIKEQRLSVIETKASEPQRLILPRQQEQ